MPKSRSSFDQTLEKVRLSQSIIYVTLVTQITFSVYLSKSSYSLVLYCLISSVLNLAGFVSQNVAQGW